MTPHLRDKEIFYEHELIELGIVRNKHHRYRLERDHDFPKGHKPGGAAANVKPWWPRNELKDWCDRHDMGHIFPSPTSAMPGPMRITVWDDDEILKDQLITRHAHHVVDGFQKMQLIQPKTHKVRYEPFFRIGEKKT